MTKEIQENTNLATKSKLWFLVVTTKERISLGIRQLENSDFQAELENMKGLIVSCAVIGVEGFF